MLKIKKSYAVLIPAKSYSRKLPGKNFMEFNGKPLIDWTIEFAKSLPYPIYVSTDMRDFKRKGVKTLLRPAFIAQDIDMRIVVEHAIKKIKEDIIILLQPTSPMRGKNQQHVKNMVKLFETHNMNIIPVNIHTLIPNGYCFVFPKHNYIWDYPVYCYRMQPYPDIDYIWDFRIAEAMINGNYS